MGVTASTYELGGGHSSVHCNPCLTLYTKNEFKIDQRPKCKSKTIKLSEENMGKYEVVKDFFKKTQKAQTIKEN